MTGSDHRAQCDQQEGAGYDEGNTDEGFGKRHDKGDRKAPDGMSLSDARDPGGQLMKKPMEKLMQHALLPFVLNRFFLNKDRIRNGTCDKAGNTVPRGPRPVAGTGDIFDKFTL